MCSVNPQSFASDTFQARKTLLVATCTVSFIGAAIAPGAKDIYRVIVAQILIGVGFAAVPLAYAIPSEVCLLLTIRSSELKLTIKYRSCHASGDLVSATL